MNYHLHFEHEELPSRPNEIMRKKVIWKKRAERLKWEKIIALKTAGKRPSLPLTSVKIKCIRFSSSQPDYGGLVESFKFVIDAFVRTGILVDDSPKIIKEQEYIWEKTAPKKGKVSVDIWAI